MGLQWDKPSTNWCRISSIHSRSPQIRATLEAKAMRRSATLSFGVLSGRSEEAWA